MNKDMLQLKNKFTDISNMGWIKSLRNGSTGIGYTFEYYLGKKEDSFFLPDFNGIEIKTHRARSNSSFTLFNVSPDGESFFEIKRLYKLYDHKGKFCTDFKVLNNSVICSKKTCVGLNYNFSLNVLDSDQKIYLNVYNKKNVLIDSQTYWTYNLLNERLFLKHNFLAIVIADNKYVDGVEYFRYKVIRLNVLILLLKQ